MNWHRHAVSTSLFALLLALAAPATAGEIMKHSGSIVSIAPGARSFVLAEVGPWEVRDGGTVLTYRTITLTRETEYAIVGRVEESRSGFAGDFMEVSVEPDEIYLNDYVTIDCRHEGTRLVALKVTATEVPNLSAR
jgi:hypothetical protein